MISQSRERWRSERLGKLSSEYFVPMQPNDEGAIFNKYQNAPRFRFLIKVKIS